MSSQKLRSVAMHALSSIAFGLAIFGGPANAAPIVAYGVTYDLSAAALNASTEEFTLTITGINAPLVGGVGDAEGGRYGFNAVAFGTPANFSSATAVTSGFTEKAGGLSNSGGSGGCDNTGAFFCFAGGFDGTPNTVLSPNSTLTFVFDVTLSSGDFTNWVPDLKINWVGTKNNYNLVSQNITPDTTPPTCGTDCSHIAVPEPGSLMLLGGGLIGLGFVGAFLRRRHREDGSHAPA